MANKVADKDKIRKKTPEMYKAWTHIPIQSLLVAWSTGTDHFTLTGSPDFNFCGVKVIDLFS